MTLVVTRDRASGLPGVPGAPEVWTVALHRPASANALSAELVEALHEVLDDAEAAVAHTLVLRGNERHFAAGFDLADLAEETDASLAHRFLRIGLLLERLADAPFTTVAVVEGAAIGAGADLVVACDQRLVTPGVTLRFPGSAFGVVLGAHRRRAVGEALATGTPGQLGVVLRTPAPRRPAHDADAALAALARSVAVPGLHARLTEYARTTRVAPRPSRREKEYA